MTGSPRSCRAVVAPTSRPTRYRRAYAELTAPRRIEILPRATHLFEEPGALERVTVLAADWFVLYLSRGHAHAR